MSAEVKLPAAPLPQEGGCRCGRVRFRLNAQPLLAMACHCNGCQHMTASAFSLSAAIPTDAFSVIQGETVLGGLHGGNQHFYCGYCKSWLYTKAEGLDFFINVRVTMLDDSSWFVPYAETWTSEKLPWAQTPARRSYPQLPPMAEFQTLTQEYSDLYGK